MKKIVVGMSGGVDSSVTAYLLKEQGYEVIGATMRIWQEAGRESQTAEEDARRVAEHLGIPHFVIDLEEEFHREVVGRFTQAYLNGETPNPCIFCNPMLKWGAFYERCKELGADMIATGHYARILQLPDGRYTLQNAVSAGKDQTYVLYRLSQDQLSQTLMPLGVYDKTQVRQIAAEAGLPVAEKKDSQDICFIPDGDFAGFIRRECGTLGKSGPFVLLDGEDTPRTIGMHDGTARFTIGQRKGLGVAAGRPVYVCGIDAGSGQVFLGDHDRLMQKSLTASRLGHMGEARFDENKEYLAKTRYSQKNSLCHVTYIGEDQIRVDFEEPVRAITPGQSVVLYTDDWIAGGGVIE